jgi:hypothetical protein
MMPTRVDGPRVDAQNLNDRFDGWEPDSGANGAPASFPTIPARLEPGLKIDGPCVLAGALGESFSSCGRGRHGHQQLL